METKENILHPLLDSIEQYGKTSMELIKLEAVDKTADAASSILSRALLITCTIFFVLMISIAAALWLGELLGKEYYGFLIMALFYALTGIILFALHPKIKSRIGDSIIENTLG